MEITITITPPDIAARVAQYPARMLRAVVRAMDEQNELTASTIITKRLNFPRDGATTMEGLRHITGRLYRSIRKSDAVLAGGGVASAIGSNVNYLGVHEFGFTGTVNVPGHVRRASKTFGYKFGGKVRSRRVRGADIAVRPHVRRANFPKREPIARTIRERLPAYGDAIARHIGAEFQGGPPA